VSGYVRDIVIKRTWDGDHVTIVMNPAKFVDVLGMGNIDKETFAAKQLPEFADKLKRYTKTLSGLKAHDASDVTIDELYDSAYFIDLVTDVLTEWLDKATPTNPSSPGASHSD